MMGASRRADATTGEQAGGSGQGSLL